MKILEYLKKNAEAFAGIPNAEELVKAVVDKMQELGFIALANNEKEPAYVEKAQLDQATSQNADLTKQVDDMKKSVEGLDEMTKANGQLKDKYRTSVLNSAIKLAAISAKAKNPDDVHKFLDMGKINLKDDDSIDGLDDQIKELTASKGYLFGDTSPAGSGFNPPGGGGNGQKDPDKMTMNEYAQYYSERSKQQ